MDYFYINLERRPDRKAHMEKQFNKANISNYHRIDAIDGLDLNKYNLSLDEIKLFRNADYKSKPFSKKIIGNQLTHLRIIKKLINSDYKYAVIMQDDMEFCKNFNQEVENVINNYPAYAEVINIGFHKYAAYQHVIPYDLNNSNTEHIKQRVNNYVCKLNHNINPCSSAYIINTSRIQNFINYVEIYGCHRATDWVFNEYLQKNNIFYGSTKILCTGAQMGSDIFC
uniref:Glycosyl transferase family 25 domain-containing protein n=1 Tax=viral metagenome TaxID=1070528 RepID=A0A6C0F910_9ZZZZ|tara:strand:- start:8901 stop:9578 length:678 start_codon:yes stop_codon:yes gene_type:complete